MWRKRRLTILFTSRSRKEVIWELNRLVSKNTDWKATSTNQHGFVYTKSVSASNDLIEEMSVEKVKERKWQLQKVILLKNKEDFCQKKN
jgi:hypothetical protein